MDRPIKRTLHGKKKSTQISHARSDLRRKMKREHKETVVPKRSSVPI